jgi:hypothetical protein
MSAQYEKKRAGMKIKRAFPGSSDGTPPFLYSKLTD